jgi:RHS repeat-associated protein
LDLLGSVRLVTQTQNLQSFTAKYLPYGNLYATTGAENFQYTGKELDLPTGLSYYGYRYYDGQIGRFVTRDISPSRLVNPQTLNRYSYVLDNPTTFQDPNGRDIGDPGTLEAIVVTGLGFLAIPGVGEVVAIGLGVIVIGALAYDYYESTPPSPTQVSSPERYATPVGPTLTVPEAAFIAYASELANERTGGGLHAILEAKELIMKMLERKGQDFGLSGPPTKVPGGWI